MSKLFTKTNPITGGLYAVSYVLIAHLWFAIAFVIAGGILFHGNTWSVLLLAPAVPITFLAVIIAGIMSVFNRPRFLLFITRTAETLFHPRWTFHRTTRTITLITLLGGLGIAVVFGKTLLAVLPFALAYLVIWLITGGIKKRGTSLTAIYCEEIAAEMIDFFSSPTDRKFKMKDKNGKEYVDEKARLAFAKARITVTTEPDKGEGVLSVSVRNDIRGKTDEDFLKAFKAVPSSLGAYDHELKDQDGRQGFVKVTLWTEERTDATDHINGALYYWNKRNSQKKNKTTLGDKLNSWLDQNELENPTTTVVEPIRPTPKFLPIGVTDEGEPIGVGLTETNLLIGGQPGMGKSGTLAAVLTQMSFLPNVAIIGIDPKMVELGLWKNRASYITEGECCITPTLQSAYVEMERRYLVLKERGLKKITPDMWHEFPQIVLVMDEVAKVFTDPENPTKPPQASLNYALTRKLVAEGRAAGISVIMATQRPSADLVPTSLRNLIQQKIAHAMGRETDTRMVMGDIDGMKAHLIPAHLKGVGYVINEGDREPTKFRASLVMNNEEREKALCSSNDELRTIAELYPTIEEVVEATQHLRVDVPWLYNDFGFMEHNEEVHSNQNVT